MFEQTTGLGVVLKKILKYLKIGLLGGAIILVIAALGVETTKSMPDNAQVFVDDWTKKYYSPTYIYDNNMDDWQNLRPTTVSDAYELGYKPDKRCRSLGYFYQDTGVLFWSWLEDWGIIQRKKRWNPDGSWNW